MRSLDLPHTGPYGDLYMATNPLLVCLYFLICKMEEIIVPHRVIKGNRKAENGAWPMGRTLKVG